MLMTSRPSLLRLPANDPTIVLERVGLIHLNSPVLGLYEIHSLRASGVMSLLRFAIFMIFPQHRVDHVLPAAERRKSFVTSFKHRLSRLPHRCDGGAGHYPKVMAPSIIQTIPGICVARY